MTIHDYRHAIPGVEDITRVELDNGIVVLVRPNFTSPSVVVEGLVPGGALLEPVEKAGLANFHSALLMRGTKRRTFEEIYEEIESNGASLSFSAGGHSLRFGSKSLAEDLPLLLDITAGALREPTFPDVHIERVRGQIMTSLQLRAHNTRSMSGLKFLELAYPEGHPYRISLSGYPETIARITRDDIVEFQRTVGPRGAIIVVVGAVAPDEAVRMVEAALSDWENPDQPSLPEVPPAPRLDTVQEGFVHIPGKSQSDLVLGYVGPARNAEDYYAARMANSILGVFGMYGRLGDSVRQAQGLAYYSYSSLTGGQGPGPWRVIAGVAPENVKRAVATIRDEIRRIVEEPVSAEELDENKSFFKGQLVLGLETNEVVASSILSMELYGLGLDYLQRYDEIIDAITIEDVQAAAQHYLNPDAYALAVAGPQSDPA